MKTTLNFNIEPTKRKELAQAIGEYFKEDAKYTVAGYRYIIEGKAEVQKDGTVILDDSVTDTDKAFLLDYLGTCGFQEQDPEEPMVLSLSSPDDMTDEQYERLQTIIQSKQTLLAHAFKADEVKLKREDNKITFDGFPAIDQDHNKAATDFAFLLIQFAKNATRVNSTEKEITNEKYTFRNFLLRLGMIGPEYKTTRKILLENLSGSAAFKTEDQAKAHAAKWSEKKKEHNNADAE